VHRFQCSTIRTLPGVGKFWRLRVPGFASAVWSALFLRLTSTWHALQAEEAASVSVHHSSDKPRADGSSIPCLVQADRYVAILASPYCQTECLVGSHISQATKTVERWVPPHPLPNFNYIVAKARRARFSASEPHDAGMYKSPDSSLGMSYCTCAARSLVTRLCSLLQAPAGRPMLPLTMRSARKR